MLYCLISGLYYCFNLVLIMVAIVLSSLVVNISKGRNGQRVPRWLSVVSFQKIKTHNAINGPGFGTQYNYCKTVPCLSSETFSLQLSMNVFIHPVHRHTYIKSAHSFRYFLPECIHHPPIEASSCIYYGYPQCSLFLDFEILGLFSRDAHHISMRRLQ